MPIRDWSDTAANNAANPPNGAPEGMMPSSLDDTLRQIMADVRAQFENAQFFDYGDTPTYVSATQFTVPGNLTARYAANQRITASGTGTMGTIYGTISSSAYGTLTTVTVTWDAGGLDSTLSTVAVGILSNNGMPRALSEVALSGGSADNTPIGQNTAAAGKFTALTSTGTTSLGATSATSLDNTPIGQTTAAAAKFTTVRWGAGQHELLEDASGYANIQSFNTKPLILNPQGNDVQAPNGINNAPIGQTTPAAGKFTTLTSTGTTSLGATSATSLDNTPIGGTTPAAGTFTSAKVNAGASTGLAQSNVEVSIPDTNGNRGGLGVVNASGGSLAGIAVQQVAGGAYPNSQGQLQAWVQAGSATYSPLTVKWNYVQASALENTPIGQSTAAPGSFTSLNASGIVTGSNVGGQFKAHVDGTGANDFGMWGDGSNVVFGSWDGTKGFKYSQSNGTVWVLGANGSVMGPNTDNYMYLGDGSHRWSYIYGYKGDFAAPIVARAPAATNTSTTDTNNFQAPLQAIGLFIGDTSTVTGLTGEQFSGAMRFNGSNKAWGDLSYYPMAGTGNYGQFRLSTTGSGLITTPNGSLGVGKLLANTTDNGTDTGLFGGTVLSTGYKTNPTTWAAPAAGSGLFGSNTNTGAYIAGQGTATDAALVNRAGTLAVGVAPNSTRTMFNTSTDNGRDVGQFNGSISASGIYLNGGSNPLSHYEEGTFTPTFKGDSVAGAFTYTMQSGTYTRIGRVVHFKIVLKISGVSQAASGNALIAGLPYTASAASNSWASVSPGAWQDLTLYAGMTQLGGLVGVNASTIYLYQSGSGTTYSTIAANYLQANTEVTLTGHYTI